MHIPLVELVLHGLNSQRFARGCWSLFSRKPGQQWDSHGAADWGRPVAFGYIHSHLHITGGSDAPAPTLDCPLPTRPYAIACPGQPAAGGLQEHAIQHVQASTALW